MKFDRWFAMGFLVLVGMWSIAPQQLTAQEKDSSNTHGAQAQKQSAGQAQQGSQHHAQSQEHPGPSDRSRDQADRDEDETVYRGLEHAALGVMFSERSGKGVSVRDIMPDSPAERAGLRPGDRITKFDERPMNSYSDVIRFINRVEPGETSRLTIQRNGQEKTVNVRFASREEVFGDDNEEQSGGNRQYSRFDQQNDGRSRRGEARTFRENEDERYASQSRGRQQRWSYQDRRGSNYEHGVLGIDLDNQRRAAIIRNVWPDSPADQAGLRPGDRIVAIDDDRVRDQGDVLDELADRNPGDRVEITFTRNGRERDVTARLVSSEELQGRRQDNRSFYRGEGGNRYDDR
jgi:S1-C subfamily serine protease